MLLSVFFIRLFYPGSSLFMIPDFGESDVLHLNLPLKQILSESLKSGYFPLWTNLLGNGFPLLAEGQIGTFYLPNLILFRFMPLIPAYNLNLLISFFLAFTGTYLFCRKLRLGKTPATLAGIIFTFGGFLSVHLNHFNLVQAASLLPLLLYSSLRVKKNPVIINLVFFAFILSQQFFTGHFFISFISVLAVTVYWISKSFFDKNTAGQIISSLKPLFIGLIISFLFSSIQFLPTLELFLQSDRRQGMDFDTVTSFPYPVRHLITFINPYYFGSPQNATYPVFDYNWGIFWENTAYIGLIPLVLAVLYLTGLKNKYTREFLSMVIISLLLVFGRNSPLYFLFSFFPFNLFRVPSKFLLITAFFLCVSAASSLDKIYENLNAKTNISRKKLLFGLSAFFYLTVIIDLFRFSYNYPPVTPSGWWTKAPRSADFIKNETQNPKVGSLGAPYLWNEVFLKKGFQDMDLYQIQTNSLYQNQNALFQIKSPDINTGGIIPKRLNFFKGFLGSYNPAGENGKIFLNNLVVNSLVMSGTDYIITPYLLEDSQSFGLKLINSIQEKGHDKNFSYHIYSIASAWPEFSFAGDYKKAHSVQDLQKILSEKLLTEKTVIISEREVKLNGDSQEGSSIEVKQNYPLKTVLDIKNSVPAILVINRTFYPGWHIFVNGKKIQTFPVNLFQTALVLNSPQSDVLLEYKPMSFKSGKIITTAGFITAFGAVFLSLLKLPGIDPKNNRTFSHHQNKLRN